MIDNLIASILKRYSTINNVREGDKERDMGCGPRYLPT
jgi:hypothetical protein